MKLNINEKLDKEEKVIKLFFSGEIKLPKQIEDLKYKNFIKNKNIVRIKNGKRTLSTFKECGDYFRQYFERNNYWKNLIKKNPD